MRHVTSLPSPILASSSVGDILGAHHHEIEAGCLEMMSWLAGASRGVRPDWGQV